MLRILVTLNITEDERGLGRPPATIDYKLEEKDGIPVILVNGRENPNMMDHHVQVLQAVIDGHKKQKAAERREEPVE